MKHMRVLSIIIVICVLSVVGIGIFFVHKTLVARGTSNSAQKTSGYSLDMLTASSIENCRDESGNCYVKVLEETVVLHGPKASLELLKRFQKDGLVSAREDDHQISHSIGRITAKTYGVTGESFLRCDTSFNYGCQHGFFEYALGVEGSAKEAAEKICGSFQGQYSAKFVFYCYHGVGHGVLMAKAYDVIAALETCDSLKTSTGKDGCWQGVFMENVNAGMRGEARKGQFSKADPLLPCSRLADIYKQECFINHAGWLIVAFSHDMTRASAACLEAPSSYIATCIQSLGLMVSNPTWQSSLVHNAGDDSVEAIAWKLCAQFPEKYIDQCVIGAVDNLLNFHELDLTLPKSFCDQIPSSYAHVCNKQIGSSLRGQLVDADKIREACMSIKGNEQAVESCLEGAGLVPS